MPGSSPALRLRRATQVPLRLLGLGLQRRAHGGCQAVPALCLLLEALAAGVPVAAFPVAGPIDVIGDAPVGSLDHDLRRAALQCLEISRKTCRDHALKFSWRASAEQFLRNLVPISGAVAN